MKVCITDPRTGKKTCFYIPILVHRWPPINPLERIGELKEGPQPEPWIAGDGIKPETAHDLQTLASIQVLAASLSKGAKAAVQEAVRSQVGTIQLPEGFQVSFDR